MGNAFLTGFYLFNRTTFDRPGTFYSSFFEFSTGFERLMKIAIILDHKIKNNLASPTDKQLRGLGHSITECYEVCRAIAAEKNHLSEEWFSDGSLEYSVLTFFSDFAQGSRYYNLNQLVQGRETNDPLTQWYRVQMAIVEAYLPPAKREAIMQLARNHCDRYKLYGWERGPSGQYELTIDVTYQLEVFRRTRGHGVWTILNILRPFYDLLGRLCDDVHQIEMSKKTDMPTVPYMKEFVPFFLCTKRTAIRRKDWLSLGFGI